MAAKKTIQHFTHSHPLVEVWVGTEFLCDGCNTLGLGKRYRCEPCDFNLHDHCGTCPMELSSFMHDHSLELVVRKAQGAGRIDLHCDLCDDPVEGLFYRCSLCDFDVHPVCTQLPQDVRHVMHKDHPLRLQRSVPGQCMFCYNTCTSWRYRFGLCSFDLHLECVLAPCEEATTSRSFRKPSPPQSSPSPGCGYGYGGIPTYAYGAAYGYGGIPTYAYGAAYGYGYGYGYGGIPTYPYGVPLAPPYSGPYANGYGIPSSSFQNNGYGIPSSSFQNNVHSQHSNGYEIPSSSFQNNVHSQYSNGYEISSSSFQNIVHSQHSDGSQGQGEGGGGRGKTRKKMYAIALQLTLGVLSNVLFGVTIGPFFT